MNYQRSLKGRLEQVHRWLHREYLTPHPTTFTTSWQDRRRKDSDDGGCYRWGRAIHIDVNLNQPWTTALDALLHEYAHALVWPRAHLEDYQKDHGEEWALAYGRLYRRYNDEDGAEESQYL